MVVIVSICSFYYSSHLYIYIEKEKHCKDGLTDEEKENRLGIEGLLFKYIWIFAKRHDSDMRYNSRR